MNRKNVLAFVAVLIWGSTAHADNALWYGTFTTPEMPVLTGQNCSILQSVPVTSSRWVQGTPVERVHSIWVEAKKDLERLAMDKGYNAIVGYHEFTVSGASSNGLLNASTTFGGTAIKYSCK